MWTPSAETPCRWRLVARTLQLSPSDTLLHLCVHLGTRLRGSHRLTISGACWPIINPSRGRSSYRVPWFRLRTVCYFPLEVCASALGALIPKSILDAWMLRRPGNTGWSGESPTPDLVLRGEVPYPAERNSLLHLAVADRPLGVLRSVAWFFFPGPRHLAERYELRGRLSPYLACLWHPLVVLWRGAANAFILAWAEVIGRIRAPAAVLAGLEIWAVALCVAAGRSLDACPAGCPGRWWRSSGRFGG